MTTVPFPRTGAPALRALDHAGYTHLQQLDGVSMPQILALHGMGPTGIGALRRAMAEHGWAFADDNPAVGATRGGLVSTTASRGGGETSRRNDRARNDNATVPTDVDPHTWVESLPSPRQREQGRAMLELFGAVTGVEPVMWGPSIVGYGQVHYVYESGREGDMAAVGFSPRTRELSLYGLQSDPASAELLDRLGPHRRGLGCVYVRDLGAVDVGVLRDLLAQGWGWSAGA